MTSLERGSPPRRVALKVDCDTAEGTREGVPRLLDLFGRKSVRATFFFTFGPDRSGLAVRRIFTRKGFLRKMVRSRGLSLYGWRTALSGTLLPAPRIGERCEAEIRSVAGAGDETGVHGWDHVRWQDGLDRMSDAEIREHSERAHAEYVRIFGAPARASAAPGWAVNARSLAIQEERSLLYASDTRGGGPFFPSAGGQVLKTLEIPTTLPTLDETLAWPSLRSEEDLAGFYRAAPRATEVHTIHAEVEGRSKLDLFSRILDDWIEAGVAFPLLSEIAREARAGEAPPVRPLARTRLAGRGGEVATGWSAGEAAAC